MQSMNNILHIRPSLSIRGHSTQVHHNKDSLCGVWSHPPVVAIVPSTKPCSNTVSSIPPLICHTFYFHKKTNRLNTRPEKQILTLLASMVILPDHMSVLSARHSPNLPTFSALPSTHYTRGCALILLDHFISLWLMLDSNKMPSSVWD